VLLWSLATLGCGLSQNYQQLFVARILVGLGEAVLSPAAISLISDCFPPQRRGAGVGSYLAGIAIGIGSALVIGGAVLHAVAGGLLAATPFAALAPWRLVLIAIGAPGLLWSLVVLLIQEPERRAEQPQAGRPGAAAQVKRSGWLRLCAVYGIVATASLVDNAVGAWAPSLLIREFAQNAEAVGINLGLLLVGGYGVGFMAGGFLADRASASDGRIDKAVVCLTAALLVLPIGILFDSSHLALVMTGIPLLFCLSGIVTGCGFSAILDMVPNRSRGLAMAISFFLNVAVGAGFGPVLVSLAGDHLFGAAAGLGPPLSFTVLLFYCAGALALGLALRSHRHHRMA
jgi:MFS family permease